MARNTSITIGDHFSQFVSEQVRSGRYGSTSDVVRAGLRLLEEHEARIRALGDGAAAVTALPFDAPARREAAKAALSDAYPPSGV